MKRIQLGVLSCLSGIAICASPLFASSSEDALKTACIHADLVGIATLVEAGTNPNGAGRYLGWPLGIAIKYDDLKLVRLLLAKGANPNDASDGRCGPLWDAFDSSVPILESLLAAGADPNCVWADKSGAGDQSLSTPLMAAASMKGLRNAHGLHRLTWTDRPARKDTPRPVDVVKLLLKFGAKPNTRSYSGTNALYDAIDSDDADAARALIDGGLNINSTIDAPISGAGQLLSSGPTPLMHALARYEPGSDASKRMINLLLEKGADPNVTPHGKFLSDCGHGTPPCTFSGETPLSYVARLGYKSYARLLLEYGANPDGVRADGAKPADIATQAGHAETAALIARYEKQLSETRGARASRR